MSDAYYVTVKRLPPSMNSNTVRSHWRGFHTAKKQWERDFADGMRGVVPSHTGMFARCTAILTVPTKHRRDADNFEGVIRKALGDALQVAGVIDDDTPEHWSWTSIAFSYDKGKKATTVIVELVDPLALDFRATAA